MMSGSQSTPALSHDQVLKKGSSKRSMNSEPFRLTDTGKYCQNLKTWGKTDFLPKKNGQKDLKMGLKCLGLVWFGLVWLGYEPNWSELKPKI